MKVENVNADGLVLGRLASIVAQKLLDGYKINIYNAEKAVVTGNVSDILSKYEERREFRYKGNQERNPKYSFLPHMLLRRVVRNMLPYKRQRGIDAYKRLKVVIGNNENVPAISFDAAKPKQGLKVITLKNMVEKLGVRW